MSVGRERIDEWVGEKKGDNTLNDNNHKTGAQEKGERAQWGMGEREVEGIRIMRKKEEK